jgi:hypothetical protein
MNPKQETTPDQLMEAFRGRSFKSIILFTLIVHVVVLGGTSIPFLMKSVSGKSDSKLTEKERTEIAAREATSALRDIAEKHGLKPQDLSTRIAGGAAPAAPKEEAPAPKEDPATKPPEEAEKPKTAIEEELEVKEDGPKVPPVPTEEASDDDLFE